MVKQTLREKGEDFGQDKTGQDAKRSRQNFKRSILGPMSKKWLKGKAKKKRLGKKERGEVIGFKGQDF